MKTISEKELIDLQWDHSKKILLADVRTAAEYHHQHIQGAVNLPLDTFSDHIETLKQYDAVVCYCNSGNSSSQFVKRAESQWIKNCLNLSGGLPACKVCPIITKKWPLPMMQQVQIIAWTLVLLGIVLAKWFHMYPWHEYFIILSAFVGGGLIFAGISGRCGMAKILAKMPWNNSEDWKKVTEISGKELIIKQFEDVNLAHYSYIAISNGEALVVDPERNPKKYYDYAELHHAKIVAVFNTHPHADFASGHLQIHKDTGARIYVWSKVGAEYDHIALEWWETISFGNANIKTYFTPGHSPDSMSYLVNDASDKQIAMFTGDRVFIGDVGRADLRETVGNIKAKQEELAALMYTSTRSILPTLDDSLMILPAHGAGTSCGKWLSKMNMATLANQIKYNPMLQNMLESDFVKELTSEQPAIPAYFTNSVLLNKKWNTDYSQAYASINLRDSLVGDALVVDTRTREQSQNYPLASEYVSIPLHNPSFVGMLWALVMPDEQFVLLVERASDKDMLIQLVLSIGYEAHCAWVYIVETNWYHKLIVHKSEWEKNSDYTILDVRSEYTYETNPVHKNSINIPIEQLRSRLGELDKEVVYIPYCGWLYKSSIALSVLQSHGYKLRKMYV